jgi:hypothetical protein
VGSTDLGAGDSRRGFETAAHFLKVETPWSFTGMKKRQTLITLLVSTLGITSLIYGSLAYYRWSCEQRYAENLILREQPRVDSYWRLEETAGGLRIRARGGPFRGWYLGADPEILPTTPLPQLQRYYLGLNPLGRRDVYSTVRNITLYEKPDDACLWKRTDTQKGTHLQPADGHFKDWFLDYNLRSIPETGSDPGESWNLRLAQRHAGSPRWTLTTSSRGTLIQAQAGKFKDWYLDSLRGAHILEENICQETEPRKQQEAPLAPPSVIR